MKAQTIFNRAARHLLKQGRKSALSREDGQQCLYRGPDGLACGIGGILPDRLYHEGMEGENYRNLVIHYPAVERYFGRENYYLLCDVQHTHDEQSPEDWRMHLGKVAQTHGLSAAVLEEVAHAV